MKKALSILLIIAAFFGFYGGGVTIKDVLDCKAYWEEEGEKTTADLNKLEDGLDELGENTEAYLDGVDQVAQGEEDLAQGEKDYAAGQKKLADGEKEYAEGQKTAKAAKEGLNQLIDGLDQLKAGYDSQWAAGLTQLSAARDGYDDPTDPKADDKGHVAGVSEQFSNPLLPALAAFVKGDEGKSDKEAQDAYLEKVATLATNSGSDIGIKAYDKAMNDVQSDFTEIKNALDLAATNYTNTAMTIGGGLLNAQSTLELIAADYKKLGEPGLKPEEKKSIADEIANYWKTVTEVQSTIKNKVPEAKSASSLLNFADSTGTLAGAYEGACDTVSGAEALPEKLDINDQMKFLSAMGAASEFLGDAASMLGDTTGASGAGPDLATCIGAAQQVAKTVDDSNKGLAEGEPLVAGGIAALEAGQTELENNINFIFSNMTAKGTVETLAPAFASTPLTAQLWDQYVTQLDGRNKDATTLPQAMYNLDKLPIETFATTMDGLTTKVDPGIQQVLRAVIKGIDKQLADARKQIKKGKKDLADGAAKLNQGRQDLADGKAQLAEYEDGEQQIRDGLATLMDTEANGGLKSIEDRIGADEDFSLADGNLDFDAGYNGVDVGRAYSADSSVLITKELTQRAVGFGIGIFAGLIAIVAAILGFKKKYKGAAVLGLLAAVAAGVGAMVAKKAGLEFSAIAGSALGIAPMASLAILAGIAVVHAIAYFTAPKEA